MANKNNETILELIEQCDRLLDVLNLHGNIDPVREEGLLFDLETARDNAYLTFIKD